MRAYWKQLAFVAALSVGASTFVAIPAIGQQDRNRSYPQSGTQAQRSDPDTYANHPDYSNNEYYRTGNDEGYQDYQAKKRRESHNHQYRNDDDRKAHDYGYDQGWSGRNRRDDRNSRGNQTYGDNQYRTRQNDQYRNRDNSQYQNRDNTQYQNRENQKHDKDDDHDSH